MQKSKQTNKPQTDERVLNHVYLCYVSHDGAPAPGLSRKDISQKGQISYNSSAEASVKSCLPSKQGNVLKASSMFCNTL